MTECLKQNKGKQERGEEHVKEQTYTTEGGGVESRRDEKG